jgi:molybdopterin-binding protein
LNSKNSIKIITKPSANRFALGEEKEILEVIKTSNIIVATDD